MQTKNNLKNTKTTSNLISICKVNKYLTVGQVKELERLKYYKSTHDCLTWESQDDWFL